MYEPAGVSSTSSQGVREDRFEAGLRDLADLTVRPHEPLARFTTFRIGGPARWLIDVPSSRSLARLLQLASRTGVSIHALGLGSNVLFPDQGLTAAVVRLGGEFKAVRIRGGWVSAGANDPGPCATRFCTGCSVSATGLPASRAGKKRSSVDGYWST